MSSRNGSSKRAPAAGAADSAAPNTRLADGGIGDARPAFRVSSEVLDAIEALVASRPPESGGMLGGSYADGVVRHFWFDATARTGAASYTPDTATVNRLLAERWNPMGIRLLSFVHSHPGSFGRPSEGDRTYAREILAAIPDLDRLFLPIVAQDRHSGRALLRPYVATRTKNGDVTISEARLVVDPDGGHRGTSPSGRSEALRRVRSAYDLDRQAKVRIVYVGVGGAAALAEDMARTGIRDHVLIDGDIVERPNLATQHVASGDAGRAKVGRLAERLHGIDPEASVLPVRRWVEEVDDDEFERLLFAPLEPPCCNWIPRELAVRPTVTLLCGFTDSFHAQARVNRLALKFGVPSLCAQLYREGRGAEITFTYPGVTPACHRCVLSSRYAAYLEQGFANDVTSDGAPIFATTRLNALCGFVAMALLHHGSTHPRWGGLLKRIGGRNLVQIRLDPDLRLRAFERALAGADQERILFDEAVWLPQLPDGQNSGHPTCPDCGGTGDLRHVIGRATDTRLMRGHDGRIGGPAAALALDTIMSSDPRGDPIEAERR